MSKLSQHISHFLIGIPASGKSTFAQWLQRQTGAILISTDEIRAQLYGDRTIQGDWLDIEREVLRQIEQATMTQNPIIYDATNCNQTWRRDFLSKSPSMSWLAWCLQSDLATCLERNQRRSRQVPVEIMQKMAIDLQTAPPQQTEGFIEVITLNNTDPATLKDLKKQHSEYLGD